MPSPILLRVAVTIAVAAFGITASPLQSASITTTTTSTSVGVSDPPSARPTPTRGYWTTEYTSCGMETCEIVYSTVSSGSPMSSSSPGSTIRSTAPTMTTPTADTGESFTPRPYIFTLPRGSGHGAPLLGCPTPSSL
ncbi:hypothetical protein F4775DRAFT_595221 [Biscogniauxia sp. FL1348]|nr:hypothetical protein F4775DRAFT_595221 [Biscogniauxia sp. FL1348]